MADFSQMTPASVCSLRLQLGESPVWDRKKNRLMCVDIELDNIHQIDPATGNVETHSMGRLPAAIGLCQSGQLIVGKLDGVFLANFNTKVIDQLCNPVSHQPSARLYSGMFRSCNATSCSIARPGP